MNQIEFEERIVNTSAKMYWISDEQVRFDFHQWLTIHLDRDLMDNNIDHIDRIEDFSRVYPMFYNETKSIENFKNNLFYRNIVLTVEGNCRCKSLTNVSVSWKIDDCGPAYRKENIIFSKWETSSKYLPLLLYPHSEEIQWNSIDCT